jgi:ATPases with chaperone activity, ATP-binding subunit
MSPEKLTETSLKALMLAQNLAAEKQHQYIEPDHLLLAILEQTDSLGVRLLQLAEVDINRIKTEIDNKLKQLPQVSGTGGQYLSRNLDEILRKAEKEADKNGDSFVSVDLYFTS